MDPLGGAQFPAEGGQVDANTTEPLNAASAAAVQNLLAQVARNSAFTRMAAPIPGPSYSDMMAQAFQAQAQPHLVHLLAQANGLNFLGMPQQPMQMPAAEAPPLPSGRGRQTRSGGDGRTVTNNSYASRHQQAEARRRSRINERLDALRKIVPHTERANTAAFLEDVVRYVQRLQHRVLELELKLGLPPTVTPPAAPISFGDSATPEGTLVTNNTHGGIDRLALQAVLQQAAATVAAMPATGPHGQPVAAGASGAPPPRTAAPTSNAPVLPSVSEELAMAAQLAPSSKNNSGAEKAMMAESQPPATAAEVAAAAAAAAVALNTDEATNGLNKRQQSIPEEGEKEGEKEGEAGEQQVKRRRGS